MPDPQILSVATSVPQNVSSLEEVACQAQAWVSTQEKKFQTKVDRIFRRAGVAKRYTTLPLKALFEPMTLAAKNHIYRDHIIDYAEKVLLEAIAKAGIQPTDLDCLIVTSCTGHMSPSLDAFLIDRVGLKPSIQRLPIMEMGCIGGVAALMYAENYCRAYPTRYSAVIAAELTSITFQREDYSWANIVSTAIFGDGIACAIVGGHPLPNTPRIRFSSMHHFPDSTHLLGFDLGNNGFQMVLDASLPSTIRQQFMAIVESNFSQLGWILEDVEAFLIHPGGLKILSELESLIAPIYRVSENKGVFQLTASRRVLENYGNMSSATVLFLLKEWLDSKTASKRALMAGFGPGLTAGVLLLEAGDS